MAKPKRKPHLIPEDPCGKQNPEKKESFQSDAAYNLLETTQIVALIWGN